MTTIHSYKFEDYNRIMFDGFDYYLPSNINDIISNLSFELETYSKNSQSIDTIDKSQKKSNNYNSSGGQSNRRYKMLNQKKTTDDNWENLRVPFKSTVLEKKEGIDKSINDIRIRLNKISTKTYDILKDEIIEQINIIKENEESTNEDLTLVVKSIFDIASNNKFYSSLYADLYKELSVKFTEFTDIINDFIYKYKESLKDINYIDPNIDYDKFCDYNKKNDTRKALSMFIVNLMKKELIEKKMVIEIIFHLQELALKYIDEPNKTNEIEEITENLFIIITSAKEDCVFEENWDKLMDNIKEFSLMKVKEKVSMSSRALFKFRDILDTIKK
jgi:hypothetical protein